MKNFFEDKQLELKGELESWLYTPYRHWGGDKGAGTDCIHFVCRVYEALGACPEGGYKLPYCSPGGRLNNEAGLLLAAILDQMNVRERPLREPEDGNLFLFRYGGIISHAAIFCDRHLYHAITHRGVRKLSFLDRRSHRRKRYNYMIIGDE